MCRRLLGILAAVPWILPVSLAGQSPSTLRGHADSLLSEWREAAVFADVQDSIRRAARVMGRDTLRVGSLRILVNPSPLPVRRAAGEVWPLIAHFYGSAASHLAEHPVSIQAVDPDTAAEPLDSHSDIQIPWDMDERQLARVLIGLADLSGLDRGLHDWLGGALFPAPDAEARHARVYIQLVTAPAVAVRRCFQGDRVACRDALSLSDSAGWLTRWYDAEERRELVTRQYAGFLDRGARAAEFRSCAVGSDAACLDLLESLPPGSLVRPLDYEARLSFLETAIELGGPAMFERLLGTPPGPMGARLAVAAAVSEDSLTARWRVAILAARPKPVSLPPLGIWVAFGWTAVFLTCGLRSSRWRVS